MAIAVCCTDLKNRASPEKIGDGTVEKCLTCGRNHYSVVADKGVLLGKGVDAPATQILARLVIQVDSNMVVTLRVENLNRDKSALLGLLDQAKAIIDRNKELL